MCGSCKRNQENGGYCDGKRKNCNLMTENTGRNIIPNRKIKHKGLKLGKIK
jgi:hypothetical protein